MMIAYMPRKSFEPGGFVYDFLGGKCRTLPSNVAAREKTGKEWRDVNWDEVMQRRREHQAERLERIHQISQPSILPCYVWTFYVPGDFFSGWYCYVVTRNCDMALNFRGFNWPLAESIMLAVPMGFLPMRENFEAWMIALARRHPRRKPAFTRGQRDPRQAGVILGWLKDRRTFSLNHPSYEPNP